MVTFLDHLFKRAQEEATQEENPVPLENGRVLEDNPAMPQTAPVETRPLGKSGKPYLDTDDQAPPSMGDNVMAPENNPQVAVLPEEETVALEEQIAAEATPTKENQTPTPDTQLELLPGLSTAISRSEVNLLSRGHHP